MNVLIKVYGSSEHFDSMDQIHSSTTLCRKDITFGRDKPSPNAFSILPVLTLLGSMWMYLIKRCTKKYGRRAYRKSTLLKTDKTYYKRQEMSKFYVMKTLGADYGQP